MTKQILIAITLAGIIAIVFQGHKLVLMWFGGFFVGLMVGIIIEREGKKQEEKFK